MIPPEEIQTRLTETLEVANARIEVIQSELDAARAQIAAAQEQSEGLYLAVLMGSERQKQLEAQIAAALEWARSHAYDIDVLDLIRALTGETP